MVDQRWGDESYADGTPAYGDWPNLYVRIQPWSTQPETTTGKSLRVTNGELVDIYQGLLGQSEGVAGIVRQPISGGGTGVAGDGAWLVERQNQIANSNVSFAPALYPIVGTPDFDSFKQFGVCSHVSGGTAVTTGVGTSHYYTNVDGLFLIEEKQSATRHFVLLLRVQAGAITVLGNEEVRVTDSVHAQGNAFDFFRPAALRLNVQEVGAARRVRAYRTDLTGVEKQLFGTGFFTVTGLADGRCGFGIQTRRTSSEGCDSVGVCNLFTIRNEDNTALLFADTFERAQPGLQEALSDGLDFGRSLMSSWVGDEATAGQSSVRAQLRRDTVTANRVTTGEVNTSPATGRPGFHLQQIAPTSTEQRNAAVFTRLNQDISITSRMGVLSRLTIQPIAGSGNVEAQGTLVSGQIYGRNKSGYATSVVYDPAATPVWSLEIRHFAMQTALGYEGDVLATADLTSFSLSVGTAFTLDVETRNFDGDVFGQGAFVAILSKVNATPVLPVAENSAGLLTQGNSLVDTRSAATGTRGGVGFFVATQSQSATGELVAISSFQALAVTDPPVIRPDEQESVPISAEAASASGSLTIPLDATVQEDVKRGYWLHTFESGKQQTIANQGLSRRVWRVSAVMTSDQWEALTSLLAANGVHTPFSWQHPYTKASHTVLFGQDEIRFQENGSADYGYNASFELIEVFTQQTYNPEL